MLTVRSLDKLGMTGLCVRDDRKLSSPPGGRRGHTGELGSARESHAPQVHSSLPQKRLRLRSLDKLGMTSIFVILRSEAT